VKSSFHGPWPPPLFFSFTFDIWYPCFFSFLPPPAVPIAFCPTALSITSTLRLSSSVIVSQDRVRPYPTPLFPFRLRKVARFLTSSHPQPRLPPPPLAPLRKRPQHPYIRCDPPAPSRTSLPTECFPPKRPQPPLSPPPFSRPFCRPLPPRLPSWIKKLPVPIFFGPSNSFRLFHPLPSPSFPQIRAALYEKKCGPPLQVNGLSPSSHPYLRPPHINPFHLSFRPLLSPLRDVSWLPLSAGWATPSPLLFFR